MNSNFCSALLFTTRVHRENPETTAITVVDDGRNGIDMHCGAVMLRLTDAEATWLVSRLNGALARRSATPQPESGNGTGEQS